MITPSSTSFPARNFKVATSNGGNGENKEDEEAQHGNLDRDMSGYLENDLSI